jgi:iron(III) transport system substrate-binding protein
MANKIRNVMGLAIGTVALIGLALPVAAQSLDAVIAGAKKEGAILWYDSLPAEEGNAILKSFQQEYPFITNAMYLEVPGSAKTARVNQESRAGGPTGDVVINSAFSVQADAQNGFLHEVDWKALGIAVSPELTPDKYMIAATTSTYGILYNTNKVKAEDAPKTWEQVVDPKWKKRIGTWSRAVGFLSFDEGWGEAKTTQYVRQFAALEPQLFRSTYTAAQSVGAGEVDLALTIYHTAVPTMEKGAPVAFSMVEPVPLSLLYGTLLKYGKNPNAGKLFLKWLASNSGALAYEKVAKRGNYLVPETATAKMLAGKKLAFDTAQQEIAKAERYGKLEGEYGRILTGR